MELKPIRLLRTLLLFQILNNIVVTANYGFRCKTDSDCEAEGEDLSCINQTCVCDEGIGLVRETHSQSCAIPVGGNCINSTIPCVANARCDEETGTCGCNPPNYSMTVDGLCLLNYGQICERGVDCNHSKFLRCSPQSSRCTCANDDEQVYDEESGKN